ncbi:MAG: SsrA-binding protein SmpB [Proteobacteria bacterium]|nr:SsrA-binding protein SmpB [Pseudomonadota bacterium]
MNKGAHGKAAASPLMLVCSNGRAMHRYHILDRLECGLVLLGSEVKSLRARQANLEGAFATVDAGELYLNGMYIAPYSQATHFGHEPKRKRKLLARRAEIERLMGKLAIRGYTLVPLRVYFKRGRAKVELGLGKGKRVGDKRQSIRRELDRREARDAVQRARK